jgi:2-phosphosulfolactate phosphatase
MRVHVALTPADFPGLALEGRAALVVDVLRATTTVVAACAAGCARIVPVADRDAALAAAARYPLGDALLAGERGGMMIAGFHLGNSPLEFVSERVAGRTVILTTTNGTEAMLHACRAAVAATAALVNAAAAARWALEQGRDVTILCAGERRAFSLEDTVCAGIVVERMLSEGGAVELTDAALAALRLGEHYAGRLDRLALESEWGRNLGRQGRAADLEACLRLATSPLVPVFEAGMIVPGPGSPGVGGDARGPARGRSR